MKTIQEVKIGDRVENNINGIGIIIAKTNRTITVIFGNGKIVKLTYKHKDSYFYESDFR